MHAIEVEGLRKAYGAHRVVDGVDLTVASGEVLAVLGPNGAGKTTTVEILEGHRRRDAGRVQVLGVDPQHADRGWRSRVGIVSQDVADVGDLTVVEAVRHFSRLYPHPVNPDELIEVCGLTSKRRARIATLSGGQRRRVDVALGIVGNPELLFLDEPTTGFDPQARTQFWDLIGGLSAGGTTVLLTTHYLHEAEALADRIAVLKDGRIAAEGSPSELVAAAGGGVALVSWRDAQGAHCVPATDPAEHVARLRAVGPVTDLRITQPTLEAVYLRLIGVSS